MRSVICTFGFALALAGSACGQEPRMVSALLKDVSGSTTPDCGGLAGQARALFGADDQDYEKKSAWLFFTGSSTTAHEPRLISSASITADHRFVTQRDQRQKSIGKMTADCDAALKPIKQNPVPESAIYNGLQSVMEELRSECAGDPRCAARLMVTTDGEETVVPKIVHALAVRSGPMPDVPKIDNTGIDVEFCGLSQTVGSLGAGAQRHVITQPRTPASHERLRAVWRSVFTHPERITFRNFCDAGSGSGPSASNLVHGQSTKGESL